MTTIFSQHFKPMWLVNVFTAAFQFGTCIAPVLPIFRSADGEDWQLDYGHSAYQSSEVPVRMIPTSRNCKSDTSEGRLSFSNTATGVE